MSGFTNTTATAVLNALAKQLRDGFAKKHGATVTVAADPAHAMDILAAGTPGGAAIVLFYLDDAPAGEEGLDGDTLVESSIRAAVVQHPGLSVKTGLAAPTVLALADKLRSFITKLSIDGVLGGMSYDGMTHLKNYNNEILHGYALTFKVSYAFEIE